MVFFWALDIQFVYIGNMISPSLNFASSPRTKVRGIEIGLSGVRALPLAAGRNVGGHYKWHFFLLSLSLSSGSLLILTEGVVVGFRNFACAPN